MAVVEETWFTRRVSGTLIHNWPSNFFIEPDNTHVEGEFQSEKHAGHVWRQIAIEQCSPGQAKKLGRHFKLTPYQQMEWDNRKIAVMKDLLRLKIFDHPMIAFALISTGDEDLIEYNWWHDNFWGWCTCRRCAAEEHENWLGRTWMSLRDELAQR